jgi:hypothetical protein
MKKHLFILCIAFLGISMHANAQCPDSVKCSGSDFIFYYSVTPPNADTIKVTVSSVDYYLTVTNIHVPSKTLTTTKSSLSCTDVATTMVYYKYGSVVGTDCNSSVALPVTWINFNTTSKDSKVYITFTVVEEHNKEFTLQRYSKEWITIYKAISLTGYGLNTYTMVDNTPLNGNNYYRIIQEDINGTISESPYLKASVYIPDLSNVQHYDILGRSVDSHYIITTN